MKWRGVPACPTFPPCPWGHPLLTYPLPPLRDPFSTLNGVRRLPQGGRGVLAGRRAGGRKSVVGGAVGGAISRRRGARPGRSDDEAAGTAAAEMEIRGRLPTGQVAPREVAAAARRWRAVSHSGVADRPAGVRRLWRPGERMGATTSEPAWRGCWGGQAKEPGGVRVADR